MRMLLAGALLGLASSAAASLKDAALDVSLEVRTAGDGERSLLLEVLGPADQTVDEVRPELPTAEGVAPLLLPARWTITRKGRSLRLGGPPASLPLRIRLRLGGASVPSPVKVGLRSGGRGVFRSRVAVATPPPLSVAGSLEGVMLLPPRVSPGEEIELDVLDTRRTPPGGTWTIAGARAERGEGSQLRVRIPEDLPPGGPVAVRYEDVWGDRILDVPASSGIEVVPAPPAKDEAPRLLDCAPRAALGDVLCVCGWFPRGSRLGFTIGGRPAGRPVSSSRRTLYLRVPEDLPPGPYLVGGDPVRGFRLSDQVFASFATVGERTDAAAVPGGEPTSLPRCPCAARSDEPEPEASPRILITIETATDREMAGSAQAIAASHGLSVLEVHALPTLGEGLVVLGAAAGTSIEDVIALLRKDRRVRSVQPDLVYETTGERAESAAPLPYGPSLIRADRLPGEASGEGVLVALIDTGIDMGHPALQGTVELAVDLTGQGFTPDVHGTLVAGILSGRPWRGIHGVAPRARLLPIKACQPRSARSLHGTCWSSVLARAVDLAVESQASVLNLSVSGSADPLLGRLLAEAVRRGAVVVAAAGHQGPADLAHSASLESTLAVSAVDAQGHPYPPATVGAFVDLSAPGVEIVSTAPGGEVATFSGTSAAAAFVSATVALLRQSPAPSRTPEELQALLEGTARDLGPPGKDPQFGAGLLDACRALGQARGEAPVCPDPRE